jgi:uncharacterized protein YpmB
MVSLAVSPSKNAFTKRSTQKVTKVSDEVALALTEAFKVVAGDEVERDIEGWLEWYEKNRTKKINP